MLRREADPDSELVGALAAEAVAQMTCQHCDATSLTFQDDPFADEAWPEAKACVACGEPIAPERLELFPQMERCAACQSSAERGEPIGNDREFCARCGDVLKMRVRHGRAAEYEFYCPGCGARQ